MLNQTTQYEHTGIWRKLITDSLYKFTNFKSDFGRTDWTKEWDAFVQDAPRCDVTGANHPGTEHSNWEGKRYYESGRLFFLLRFAMYLYQPYWVFPAPGEKTWLRRVFVLPDIKNLEAFLGTYTEIMKGRPDVVSPLYDKDLEEQPAAAIVSFPAESPYAMIHSFGHLPSDVLKWGGVHGGFSLGDMLYGVEVFTYKREGKLQVISECFRVDVGATSVKMGNEIQTIRETVKNYALRHLLIHNTLLKQPWTTGMVECIVRARRGERLWKDGRGKAIPTNPSRVIHEEGDEAIPTSPERVIHIHQKPMKRRSPFQISDAVALQPYQGDTIFFQSPDSDMAAGSAYKNGEGTALLTRERSHTGYYFSIALHGSDLEPVPHRRAWVESLFEGLTELTPGGNQTRTPYPFSLESVILRLTPCLCPQWETPLFDQDGGVPFLENTFFLKGGETYFPAQETFT